MLPASLEESLQNVVHALAIRFVGLERIATLDAVGEVDLVERRCRQRAIRCVELSGLKVLDEDGSSLVIGVGSVEEAARIARDVSGALSTIPPVAGIRVAVGCGFATEDARAIDFGESAGLFARARAAARDALDDQLLVADPRTADAEDAVGASASNAQILELTPGIAVDRGVDVLYVAFNNQITNLVGSGQRVVVGRGDSADIRIADPRVSRLHGRISFENGKAYFTDLSTNGSHVINAAGESVQTKKQTVELGASGQIVIGYDNGVPIHPPIRYVVSRMRGGRAEREQEDIVVEFGEAFDGMVATRVL